MHNLREKESKVSLLLGEGEEIVGWQIASSTNATTSLPPPRAPDPDLKFSPSLVKPGLEFSSKLG